MMKTFYLVNKGHGLGPPRFIVEATTEQRSWGDALVALDTHPSYDPEWSIVISATCFHKAYNAAERVMLDYHCKMVQCSETPNNTKEITKL